MSTPKLLLLSEDKNELSYLREIIGEYASVAHATTLVELSFPLHNTPCAVLLCGWPFCLDEWNGKMKQIREQFPDLPVIVLSDEDTTRQWMAVLEAGAFDLLTLPLSRPTLLPAVEQARASHDARRMQRAFSAP